MSSDWVFRAFGSWEDLVLENLALRQQLLALHAKRPRRRLTAIHKVLPFPADTFDAVVSRFGVMFFPSPVDGVREMLRVLKPGRKLALAVWHFAENNPFHYALARVIERFVDSPPPAPDAPDAFRFASPGKLRGALAEAGAMSPSERLLQFTIQASTSVEDFWTLRGQMSEKLREKLATLSGEQLTEVKRQALEVLRGYSTERGMSFPAEVLIVTGTKIHQA
jgi:SAM-dependent methyltransferase